MGSCVCRHGGGEVVELRVHGLWVTSRCMKRILIATVACSLSALAVAGPAQADDAGFFAYLDSHGYNYSNPYGDRDYALYNGRLTCQYPDLMHRTQTATPSTDSSSKPRGMNCAPTS